MSNLLSNNKMIFKFLGTTICNLSSLIAREYYENAEKYHRQFKWDAPAEFCIPSFPPVETSPEHLRWDRRALFTPGPCLGLSGHLAGPFLGCDSHGAGTVCPVLRRLTVSGT